MNSLRQPTLTWEGAVVGNGRYDVRNRLGQGGMAVVYRAFDYNLRTDVVIKTPHSSLADDPLFLDRFYREVTALVSLTHPHVVRILDVGHHEGIPFAVLQFLAGGSLEDRTPHDERGNPEPVTLAEIGGWLPAIAAALDFVAETGRVHRDVKPANILFDQHGNAYLSDFGIVKAIDDRTTSRDHSLTGDGNVIGTARYLAPEVILQQPYDARVDQYALAVTVYELLSGSPPYDGPNVAFIAVQQQTTKPPVLHGLCPSLPATVCDSVMRGLSKDPRHRFASCRSFAAGITATTSKLSAASIATRTPVTKAPVTKAPVTKAPVSERQLTPAVSTPALLAPPAAAAVNTAVVATGNTQAAPVVRSSLASRVLSVQLALQVSLLLGAIGLASYLGWEYWSKQRSPVPPLRPAMPNATVASPTEPSREKPTTVSPPIPTKKPGTSPLKLRQLLVVKVEDQVVDEGEELTVRLPIRDGESAADAIRYFLQSGAPEGMRIDPSTGVVTWRPTEQHGPGTFSVDVTLSQPATLSTSVTFRVQVREINQPPTIAPVPDQSAEIDQTLMLRLNAADPDLPANKLEFRLLRGLKDGATLDPRTGEFRWTPNRTQANRTFPFTVEVTDDAPLPLRHQLQFAVVTSRFFFDGSRLGEEREDNGLGIKFCWCPKGELRMGSPETEPGRDIDELPSHVTLSGFWLGKHELTMKQWVRLIPDQAIRERELPMRVSHEQAVEYCRRFTQAEREAGRLRADWEYRLPSEAQWEYACRAGGTGRYSFGDDPRRLQEFAWYSSNSKPEPNAVPIFQEVGRLKPNAWGLHDMPGNVKEWCADFYNRYLPDGHDPRNDRDSGYRVCRGGDFKSTASDCRSAKRFSGTREESQFGFRIALVRTSQRDGKN